MSNLNSEVPSVNRSLVPVDEVIGWVEKQSEKADMGGSSARLRITAIRQLAEQIAADEANDAASMLKNIDRLRERWARRHPELQSGTAKTYAARASSTLAEYFKWEAAPDQYDPRKAPAKKDDAPKKVAKVIEPAAAAAPVTPAPVVQHEFVCLLGGGRQLGYRLPADGLKVKDALRTAYHLITMCEDYDASMTPMQVMATELQRTG